MPGSETEDFIIQVTAGIVSSMFASVPLAPPAPAQVPWDKRETVCVTAEVPEVRKPQHF